MDGEFKIERDPKTKISYQVYTPTITHKIFNHGKEMGSCKVTLTFKIQSHEQQMMTCVRTEKGVETETPQFATKKTKDSEEIKNLKKLISTIQRELVELENTNSKKQE